MVKIGILLLFLIASYLKNFEAHKELKNDSNSYQKEYKEREKNKETKDIDSFITYNKIKIKYRYKYDPPDIHVKDEKEEPPIDDSEYSESSSDSDLSWPKRPFRFSFK